MATIGQVVYNLQDFHTGGLISTDSNNLSNTITSDSPNYSTNRLDIFSVDLVVDKFNNQPFSKLGIQAPPGTKIQLNDGKLIIIGRTGVYELDEDIQVTHLKFIQPKKYKLNRAKSQEYLQTGSEGLEKAEQIRTEKLKKLNDEYATKDKDKAYWARYICIQNDFDASYSKAQSNYIIGINGFYEEDGFEELYNVIIDFLY